MKPSSKMRIPMRCRKFEARLEDYLEGSSHSEVDEHLIHCPDCRAALEDSRLAGDLLRGAWEPAGEPRQAFTAGVLTKIREEQSHAESAAAFWRPLEFLTSRLSLTAAMLLLALSVYVVEFVPRRTAPPSLNRTELSAGDFPQPPQDPVSNEEVLESLAGRNNRR
jgi:predicted anti-sigma-YlaC factor YlaD